MKVGMLVKYDFDRNAVLVYGDTDMGKYEKLLTRILYGKSDADISFADLCNLLKRLGFEARIRSSHHTFRKEGITEKINLQKDDGKAKPYQVRQVRNIILKYKFGGR